MAELDVIAYAAAKSNTKKSLQGLGALAGKPCTVDSIVRTPSDNATEVTLKWQGNDGTNKIQSFIIPDGVGVDDMDVVNNELIIKYTDGSTHNAGKIEGLDKTQYYDKTETEQVIDNKIAAASLGGEVNYAGSDDISILFSL